MAPPVIIFDSAATKNSKYIIPSYTFFELTKLTSAVFITLITKISKIASNGGILLKHQKIMER